MNRILLPLVVLIALSACTSPGKRPLRIAAAANVQFAVKEISAAFTETTGLPCEWVSSSSGKLFAQIQEGAPYDVFLSADLKYPQQLWEKEKTTAKPLIYARGKLVLWSLDSQLPLHLDSLSEVDFRHLALPNPRNAPYGEAALQALRYYDLAASLKEKFVYGESISQTNQFILSGAAELGFSAKSILLAPNLAGKGRWQEVPPESYQPIEQGAVVLSGKDAAHSAAGSRFLDFLSSPKAKKILEAYGYLVD